MKPSSLSSRVQDFQWIISTINLNLERVSIKDCWSIIIFPFVRCIAENALCIKYIFAQKFQKISFDSHMTKKFWPTNQPYKIWRWKHVKIFDLYSRHESMYIYDTTCMSFKSFCSKFVSSQFPQFLEQNNKFIVTGMIFDELWHGQQWWNCESCEIFMGKLLKY